MSRRKLTQDEIRVSRERKIRQVEGWGAEPTWTDFKIDPKDFDAEFSGALSWYSAKANVDNCKAWLVGYLQSIKYGKVSAISSLPSRLFTSLNARNYCFLARMKMRGCNLPKKYIDGIIDLSEKLIQGRVEARPQDDAPKKPPKRKPVDPIVNELYFLIDAVLEKFFVERNGILSVPLAARANAIGATKEQVRQAIDKFKGLYNEISTVLKPTEQLVDDESQLKEAYSFLDLDEQKALKMFIEGLYLEVQQVKKEISETKKKRGRKQNPDKPDKGNLRFLQRYVIPGTRLAVESRDPKEIIGCHQLWIYNAKTRQLGIYTAKDISGLSVSGSKILNYNTQKSLLKKVRHPKLSLPKFMKTPKNELDDFWESLGTAPQMIKMKVTSETVLLRIIK